MAEKIKYLSLPNASMKKKKNAFVFYSYISYKLQFTHVHLVRCYQPIFTQKGCQQIWLIAKKNQR